MAHLHAVPSSAPDIPADPFLAALEARLIVEIAGTILESGPTIPPIRAHILAEAREVYLAAFGTGQDLDTIATAGTHVDRLWEFLKGLPSHDLSKLRHPSRARNRGAQQEILEARHGQPA